MKDLNFFWERLMADTNFAIGVGVIGVLFVAILIMLLVVIFKADKSEKLAYRRWRNGLWGEEYLTRLKTMTESTQQTIEALRTEISDREEDSIERLRQAEALEEQIAERQRIIEELEAQNKPPFSVSTFFIGFTVGIILLGSAFTVLYFLQIIHF
ncbi:hypothetical protein WAF17_15580 [Bernardetia sp. ABR2-2B]|uniref:hypothetical protein n=1 Tax=Bernardetia sp. ABR2-2B TaxID=3127472 RepID=UPI0030CB19E6